MFNSRLDHEFFAANGTLLDSFSVTKTSEQSAAWYRSTFLNLRKIMSITTIGNKITSRQSTPRFLQYTHWEFFYNNIRKLPRYLSFYIPLLIVSASVTTETLSGVRVLFILRRLQPKVRTQLDNCACIYWIAATKDEKALSILAWKKYTKIVKRKKPEFKEIRQTFVRILTNGESATKRENQKICEERSTWKRISNLVKAKRVKQFLKIFWSTAIKFFTCWNQTSIAHSDTFKMPTNQNDCRVC